jgi:hypothetical protein
MFLTLADFQVLQDSHLAVRLGQDLSASFHFRGNLFCLHEKLRERPLQNCFVPVGMHNPLDIRAAWLREFTGQLLIVLHLIRQLLPPLFQQLRGSECLGKLPPPLIPFRDAEFKHGLETEAEHGNMGKWENGKFE